jgi:cytidylate kinase
MNIYRVDSKREAAEMIDRSDQERTRYIKSFTGFDQFDARNYHITINTGLVDFSTAEEMVASLAAGLR